MEEIKQHFEFISFQHNLREHEFAVLWEMIQGKTTEEICIKLGYARSTIEKYQTTIYEKLNIGGRRELARWVLEKVLTLQKQTLYIHQSYLYDRHYPQASSR
ncbi:LuxR C-terminal-related transcriptional regulator [Aneurinibacillus thermoaerophilus]|uniref:LuxR C-terminal-related transcriptional regulator n=1 Tax=Aneurinibacillus thermoaerophilus TaxID=143495 RepID=UPI002E247C88|nr:LuxR C-terminal-related transcriptional regulator [Aneurinibacillus thermoaerophilus]MED0738530.1 LuxR C-terminal-related transcriptional regulator [Aneurinibacillus thermoaerophilus]